jgi:hypothetical protein
MHYKGGPTNYFEKMKNKTLPPNQKKIKWHKNILTNPWCLNPT